MKVNIKSSFKVWIELMIPNTRVTTMKMRPMDTQIALPLLLIYAYLLVNNKIKILININNIILK